MNKKFLSAFLCGALAIASTSTFVSCKDYDDDIQDLQAQIDKNSGTIQTVKAAMETEVANLKSQLEAQSADIAALKAKDAELAGQLATAKAEHKADIEAAQAALAAEIARAEAAEAALKAKIDAANDAIAALETAINAKLDQKVDKAVYDAMVTEVYAKVAAVDTKTAENLTKIQGLEEGLKNEELARKAVAADLAEQKTALANLEEKTGKADKEINDKIAEIEKALDKKADMEEVKKMLEELEKKINEKIDAEVVTLNVFIESALRSLVFDPVYYYWGIEATELKTMNYPYYNLGAVSADVEGETTAITTANDFRILNFPVCYHMNPSTANLDGAEFNLLSGDEKFVKASANVAECGLTILGHEVKAGRLWLDLGVTDPSLVKDIENDKMVTVFATEVTLPVADKAQAELGKTHTVTSDYAAVKAVSADGGYVLSNVYKAAADADATCAERKTQTGVTNPAGACTTKCDDACPGHDGLHLFATFDEAKDLANGAQVEVAYNSTLDLHRLVETHQVADEAVVLNEELEANKFIYKFELIGSKYSADAVSEAAFAAIAEDGCTFRPQADDNGKQAAYGAEQTKAAINHQPIVRVSLYDTERNQTLAYGYIRIHIVATDEIESIDLTGAGASLALNPQGCTQDPIPAYSFAATSASVKAAICEKLSITAAEFDANYTAAETASYDGYDQYIKNEDGSFTLQASNIGVITTTGDNLTWNIAADEAEYAKYFKAVGTNNIVRAIKYVTTDPKCFPEIYVTINTGDLVVTTAGGATASFAGMDGQKIKQYWYEHNTSNEGMSEARINVNSPEDGKSETCATFESVLASQFKGNQINTEEMITIVDETADNAFAADKLTYDLQFDDKNEGVKVKGQSTNVYTLTVSADGKTLSAAKAADLSDAEAIATLEIADGSLPASVDNTKIVYQHGKYAEDILNFTAYNDFNDNFLTAIIGIKVQNQCGKELTLTDNTFNERFVRPINVASNGAEVKDAAQAKQTINLRDLISLTDWRGVAFDEHDSDIDYWKYYNIIGITVRGAAAGTSINGVINTNMNGSNINKDKLSTVSNLVEFEYNPKYPTPAIDADYGTITYTNNANNVQDFDVRIPVRVQYEWGYIDTDVTVSIKKTLGTANKR